MRIGIDCRTILNPEQGEAAGIGHYTYQLIRHLLKIDKKNEYLLFFDHRIKEEKMTKFLQPNSRVKFFPFIQYKRFLPITYSHLLITAFLNREKLDLYHSPIPHLPLFYLGASVITIHDLAIYRYPQLFPSGQFFSLRIIVPQALKKAKKIIAVSESTKKDLEDFFKIAEKKIRVIYNGLDERFLMRSTKEEIDRVKKKYNISEPYILFLGTLEPRKNIERLIEAFENLHHKSPIAGDLKLVIVGKEGWGVKKIYKKVRQSFHKKAIIFTNYLEVDDLNPLFEEARAFVYPSLYEGFGLPIIEAMAKGVPVVTSKQAGSLEEITKGAALLVNPYDPEDIARGIEKVLTDKDLAQDLIEKGQLRARDFSWDKCAKETLEVYEEAVKRG